MKCKILRRLGAAALALTLALSTAVTPAMAESPKPSGAVTLEDGSNRKVYLTLATTGSTNSEGDLLMTKGGQPVQLTAKLMDADTGLEVTDVDYNVSWTSGDRNVATVTTPTGSGSATHVTTVTPVGDRLASVTITANATQIMPDNSAQEGFKDLTATFVAHIFECEIRFFVNNGMTPVKEHRVNRGGQFNLSAQVRVGEQTYENDVTWSIENNDSSIGIVSQSGGSCTVEARAEGKTAWVVATSKTYGVSERFAVIINDPNTVPVQSVSLPATLTLTNGQRSSLHATVLPANAPQQVTWASSDPASVSVDENGNLTALKVTTTPVTITATSVADPSKFAECKVTVVAALLGLRINGTTASGRLELTSGFTGMGHAPMTISATASPAGAVTSRNTITWSSSDTSVVTIAHSPNPAYTNGLYAQMSWAGPGEATITVQSGTGENAVKGTALVEVPGVIVKCDSPVISGGRLTMKEGQSAQLAYEAYGEAKSLLLTSTPDWSSTDSSVVEVDRITGVITARRQGTATITLSVGTYEAKCTVTVAEDTEGLITLTGGLPAGSPINMNTAQARSDTASGSFPVVLDAVSRVKTGAGIAYINNLSVASTDQGVLYDEHHSVDDTGAGVGIQDKYYRSANTSQGQRPLSYLSFVPRNTFSGTAEISFTGWSTTNKSFNGLIRITVNGTGDVMYSSSEGGPVSFLASDFNLYHPNLKWVSFTLPAERMGKLYYNYISASQPGTEVTASTRYNRTGTPNIDKVTFVPADGYQGTVRISYKGADTSGRSISGTVTITVSRAASASRETSDVNYSVADNGWVSFRPFDFNAASTYTVGESLSYVRFEPPDSSNGTLFYNYRGFGDFDSMVKNTTSYYYSGDPALSGVTFVPTTTTPDKVEIKYTGYTVRGNTFTGTIHITLGNASTGSQAEGPLHYTVAPGRTVSFSVNDFNTASLNATGASLNSIQFTQMPGVSQGSLRYTRGSASSNATTGIRFYRTGASTANLIGGLYFQANANYQGTFTIPFVGFSDNNTTFNAAVTITVTTTPVSSSISGGAGATYSGTTANPIRLSASRIGSTTGGSLSYITFSSLPSSTAGRLYVGYNGFGTGSAVNTGTRYYANSTPSIDQISFVPRARYSGTVSIGYTAVSASGQSVNGYLTIAISSTGSSSYFSDMYGHTWAAPSVDYLYQNGVTNGVTATTFGPNQKIQRGDFVLMLCRAFGFTGANGYSFADVPTTAYFSQAVATAKQLGVIGGDGKNFRPYGQLTRQDAMVMINNALIASGRGGGGASTAVLSQFSDGSTVAGYAQSAVSALVQMGAVNGDNGRLYPYNPITRAEAAVILHFVMTM